MIRSVSGTSNFLIGLLSAIPYLVTAMAMVLVGTHSDRTGERTMAFGRLRLRGRDSVWLAPPTRLRPPRHHLP